MNFNDLIKKGEAAIAGKDGKVDYAELGKDAQEAYGTYNKTEGSFTDKAKAVYSGFQEDQAADAAKTEKKN